eukprot:5871833-Heterocapsa_arctica.AAC.1
MERPSDGRRGRANREQLPVRKRGQGTPRGSIPWKGERTAELRFSPKAGGQPGRLAMPLRLQGLGAKDGVSAVPREAAKEGPRGQGAEHHPRKPAPPNPTARGYGGGCGK